MNQIGPFTLTGILIVAGVLIVLGIVVMRTPMAPKSKSALPPSVLAQSQQYVDTLGQQPFETLTTAKKLLLLHAQYNLEHYALVVQYAEGMTEALQRLAPDRKVAFVELIETAYVKLGKTSEAAAFRQTIGD